MAHIPVLLNEVIQYLGVEPNHDYIDATLGGGGYTKEILKKNSPQGKVLAIDWNEDAIASLEKEIDNLVNSASKTRSPVFGGESEAGSHNEPGSETFARRFAPSAEGGKSSTTWEPPPSSGPRLVPNGFDKLTASRLILALGNFADIANIAHSHKFSAKGGSASGGKDVSGIVFDLGLSSDLLEFSGRGFSYDRDEPLVMNYESRITNHEDGPIKTAREIVNSWPERELVRIFKDYGEERQAKKIAGAIVRARKEKKIKTTGELREVIVASAGHSFRTLARIFQALRIQVNDELNNLEKGLNGAWGLLGNNGRLVVVSYHSLEDRIVKNFFRSLLGKTPSVEEERSDGKTLGVKEGDLAIILTKKPIRPSEEEIRNNPRSRSAKLRAIIKVRQ